MENLCLNVPGKFSFSVFQFLRKYSEIETEKLKNWKTEKLKNWKTESIWRISAWMSLENSVFQFLRKYFEIVPETEKLKN